MERLPEGTRGDGLVIRRWRLEDAPALHRAVTDCVEHLRPRMAWIGFEPLALDDRRDAIERWDREWGDGDDAVYGLWADEDVVGGAGLHRRIGPRGLEIGYWTHVDHLGRGLATTAARLLTDLAFTVGGVERVEIHVDPTNVASRRVPEKLGYRLVGEVAATRDLAPADTGRDEVWRVTRRAWPART